MIASPRDVHVSFVQNALLNRGYTYAKLKRYADATADFSRLIFDMKDVPVGILGPAIFAFAEYTESLSDKTRALSIVIERETEAGGDNASKALRLRAKAYLENSDHDKAYADASALLKRPDSRDLAGSEALCVRAAAYHKTGRDKDALADYAQVIDGKFNASMRPRRTSGEGSY